MLAKTSGAASGHGQTETLTAAQRIGTLFGAATLATVANQSRAASHTLVTAQVKQWQKRTPATITKGRINSLIGDTP